MARLPATLAYLWYLTHSFLPFIAWRLISVGQQERQFLSLSKLSCPPPQLPQANLSPPAGESKWEWGVGYDLDFTNG